MTPCIMVIESNQCLRELLCDVLTDEDYAVVVYATPEPALADLPRIKPDVIILDWCLGWEERGMQVLQQLRLRPAGAMLPVLVCSAATCQVQELEPFLQTRNVTVVYKPFGVEEVLGAINAVIEGTGGSQDKSGR